VLKAQLEVLQPAARKALLMWLSSSEGASAAPASWAARRATFGRRAAFQ